MADIALGHVGRDGEGLVRGQEIRPADVPGSAVQGRVRGAGKVQERRQYARGQAGAVDDAVQGGLIGRKAHEAKARVAARGPEFEQFVL